MLQLGNNNATINTMQKISLRQKIILDFVRKNKQASNKQIREYLEKNLELFDRTTVVRDIDFLIESNFLVKEGKGRSVIYKEKISNSLLAYFDSEDYFKNDPDKRKLVSESFNFQVFDFFHQNIFSKEEQENLDDENKSYRERIKKMSVVAIRKEYERLTIELSWKSSQIEGNTYTLLDTEFLIKENREAVGHPKEEALMILNHKKAIDYIVENKSYFKEISLAKIEDIHKLLVGGLGIKENIRQRIVGITGTKFRPLDNEFQIRDAVDAMLKILNKKEIHPFQRALASVLLVSYIQPFEDGNKRTARILVNAILLANDFCPLSYRSVDEKEYKKAVLLFYEQNSAFLFKELFKEQFIFSIKNYFL